MKTSSLFLISTSDQLSIEEKKSLEVEGYRTNFEGIPGKEYYFLNTIPGEKREVIRLYQLSIYNHLKSYYSFLLEGKFKDALNILIARIHYSQCNFRDQDKCQSNKLIIQGPGYSVEDFMDAISAGYYELLKFVTKPQDYSGYFVPRQVVEFDENKIMDLNRFIV